MNDEIETPQAKPLTRRQRLVCRAYFVSGFKTGRAATAMGCSRQYIYEVRTMPTAIEYLDDLEAATVDAMVQAKAAMILAPLLMP